MAMEEAKMQHESAGIEFSRTEGEYKICEWSQESVYGKDEQYYFPCDVRLDCCGRACCVAAPLMPWWLWVLLLLLVLLILCCICSLCMWLLNKMRPVKERRLVTTTVLGDNVHTGDTKLYTPLSATLTTPVDGSGDYAAQRSLVIDARAPGTGTAAVALDMEPGTSYAPPPPNHGNRHRRKAKKTRRASDEASSGSGGSDDERLAVGPPIKTGRLLHEKYTPASTPVERTDEERRVDNDNDEDEANVYDQPNNGSGGEQHGRERIVPVVVMGGKE